MVRKTVSLLGTKTQPQYPIVVPRDKHTLSRKNISPNALKVLYRLQEAGYESYLVGGCIRDHLIGIEPKDFDVVTDATPEQVHNIFANSRLIGRRFKLVHVTYGREIIEVSTFRANQADSAPTAPKSLKDKDTARSAHGIILRDNVYGTIDEDAARRDFTFNALYYNVKDFAIHDYCGGLKDIEQRQIRIIGDPRARYQEDPVRMLRAIRFAAKLNFEIEEQTKAPIKEMAHLLDHIPPARLFEEVLKLLSSGNGVRTFTLLREFGLFKYLFPDADALLDREWEKGQFSAERFILRGLENTDERIQSGKSTAPYFLYAFMLWPSVLLRQSEFEQQGMPTTPALHHAATMVLDNQIAATSIPRRFSTPMREIWDLQLRLPKRHGKRPFILLSHPRFRAAFDFLLIREESGEALDGLGSWWESFQQAPENQQRQLIDKVTASNEPGEAKKRRRPRHRRKSNTVRRQQED